MRWGIDESGIRSCVAAGLCWLLALQGAVPAAAQAPPDRKLTIDAVEGDGAVHRPGRAGPPAKVVIVDETGARAAGAGVVFTIVPGSNRAGGTFAGGASTARVKANAQGEATAPAIEPNAVPGEFRIQATAVLGPRKGGPTTFLQSNAPAGRLALKVLSPAPSRNRVKSLAAAPPRVQLNDESGAPVAGARVVFTAPASGPGGLFESGEPRYETTTDAAGEAVATGFRANNKCGKYDLRATALLNGSSPSAQIEQANIGCSHAGAILAIVAAAAGAGVAVGLSQGKKGASGGTSAPAQTQPTQPTRTPTTITIGTPTLSAP